MDERISKAFDVVNFMTTLANQKSVIKEELDQKLVFYHKGGTFKITRDLMCFLKLMLDNGFTEDVVLLDDNDLPIMVSDLNRFFLDVVSAYFEAVNDYSYKFNHIKSQRNLEDITGL